MGSLRRRVGFWSAVGRLRLNVLVTPEVGGGIVLGLAGAVFMVLKGTLTQRQTLVESYTSITGALLGIVFAGLALVVALITDDYLQYLDPEGDGEGIIAFLSPFILALGLQVGILVGSVAYHVAGPMLPARIEHVVFVCLSVGFLAAAFDIVALARSVIMHGIARRRVADLRNIPRVEDRRELRSPQSN